ncbi:tryptophan--tRNA ligase [Candidatus Margulisiibacteriota bacterium]
MALKKRALSGVQPSGKIHLGNLIGALENWVKLQASYDCFFFIADLHALTTGYADTSKIKENIFEIQVDMLSIGLDPKNSTLFVQSDIPEHAELHLLLSMITPLSWLERVPTYKSQIKELKGRDLGTYGFLGYPVLQAADILIYKADVVPVGQDQLPHLELTREIARRFNHFYKKEVLKPPKDVLTKVPVLPGIDGRKMSKSYGNAIFISDSPDVLSKKVAEMITDPARVKKSDKGHPNVCSVFTYHGIFNKEELKQIEADCKSAKIGCVECKKRLTAKLLDYLKLIHEKREKYLKDPMLVKKIFSEGTEKAKKIAAGTLEEVKTIMGVK